MIRNNKILVLFLVSLMGLTMGGYQSVFATNENIAYHPGITCLNETKNTTPCVDCNNTTNLNPTWFKPRFYYVKNHTFIKTDNRLNIKYGKVVRCNVGLRAYLGQKHGFVYIRGYRDIHVIILNSANEKIYETNDFPHFPAAGPESFRLPKLGKGDYTMIFSFSGNKKHKLAPCMKVVPLTVQ